jgi:hypothetical protein
MRGGRYNARTTWKSWRRSAEIAVWKARVRRKVEGSIA